MKAASDRARVYAAAEHLGFRAEDLPAGFEVESSRTHVTITVMQSPGAEFILRVTRATFEQWLADALRMHRGALSEMLSTGRLDAAARAFLGTTLGAPPPPFDN